MNWGNAAWFICGVATVLMILGNIKVFRWRREQRRVKEYQQHLPEMRG